MQLDTWSWDEYWSLLSVGDQGGWGWDGTDQGLLLSTAPSAWQTIHDASMASASPPTITTTTPTMPLQWPVAEYQPWLLQEESDWGGAKHIDTIAATAGAEKHIFFNLWFTFTISFTFAFAPMWRHCAKPQSHSLPFNMRADFCDWQKNVQTRLLWAEENISALQWPLCISCRSSWKITMLVTCYAYMSWTRGCTKKGKYPQVWILHQCSQKHVSILPRRSVIIFYYLNAFNFFLKPCPNFLASQDAVEVIGVTELVTESVRVSADFTDVSLVSKDTYGDKYEDDALALSSGRVL